MRKFWKWRDCRIRDQAGEETVERVLFLDGTIAEESWYDDDVTPALFKQELESGSGNITVWINSPGGDCVAAAQIYNMLMDYKGDVTVKVDGIAASAASVIAMAGTKVLMSPVSMLMIHNPSTIAFGDAGEMKKAIAMLSEVKESIMNAYEIKTGMDRGKISRLMDNETWMDAHKAVELGFADGILSRGDLQEEDPDGMEVPVMFSRAAVVNSLKDKIVAKCRIEKLDGAFTGRGETQKAVETGSAADSGGRNEGAGETGSDGRAGADVGENPGAGKVSGKAAGMEAEQRETGRCADEIRQRLNFIRKFI